MQFWDGSNVTVRSHEKLRKPYIYRKKEIHFLYMLLPHLSEKLLKFS